MDTLPDAAWFATEVMGWRCKAGAWIDNDGALVGYKIEWDPHTNDTDALMLWQMVSSPKSLHWNPHGLIQAKWDTGYTMEFSAFSEREVICKAVAAWKGWQPEKGETL